MKERLPSAAVNVSQPLHSPKECAWLARVGKEASDQLVLVRAPATSLGVEGFAARMERIGFVVRHHFFALGSGLRAEREAAMKHFTAASSIAHEGATDMQR